MRHYFIPTMLVSALAIAGCSNTNMKINTSKFKSAQQIKQEIMQEIHEAGIHNQQQFQLIEEINAANRADPSYNDLNNFAGKSADVRIQSEQNPHNTLTGKELFSVSKEGSSGRTLPKDYGRIIPNGVSTEPLQNNSRSDIINHNQSTENTMNIKPATQIKPNETVKLTNRADVLRYIGNKHNSIAPKYQMANNSHEHQKNIETIDRERFNNYYSKFQNAYLRLQGDYLINNLLLQIAEKTGYRLQIDDPKERGKSLNVRTGFETPKSISAYDTLITISNTLKQSGRGKLFINHAQKIIKVQYL